MRVETLEVAAVMQRTTMCQCPTYFLQWNMPGTGRGVNVAVHDATLVPVPGLTGRSPTAIAQEVARDREERGRKPGWSPYGGVFNNPAAFSETDQGMLHTTLAGDGFMAPPLKNSYMSNGLGAGSTMYPVQLPNGMLMNVPADEISAYPNVMPTMVQGPLSAPNSMGQEYSSTNEALSNTGAKPWVSRLAGTQAEIAQQQEFYKQYALAGARYDWRAATIRKPWQHAWLHFRQIWNSLSDKQSIRRNT